MPTRYGRLAVVRAINVALLAAAVVAVVVILLSASGGPYVLHARFQDAGQLVTGDQVQLGGHAVGSVTDISITPRGLADVRMEITDDQLKPMHLGTTATIGSPGLSGVANRYVRVDPGPGDAPEIPDGGVLAPEQTQGIVDIDTLLDSIDRPSRIRIREILREAADVFDAPTGDRANTAFALLNPAFGRSAALGNELVRDQAGLERLIRSTADVSSTLARRRRELAGGVAGTAAVFQDVATRRRELEDVLRRTPPVLRQATKVLAHTRATLTAVDPTIRHLRPVAAVAARLLRDIVPVARDTGPAVADIRGLLPLARRTLEPLPELARTTVPALRSLVTALTGLAPIVSGLRPYTPDLIAGFFEGFGGNASGYYDANGQFARITFASGPGSVAGGLAAAAGTPPPNSAGYRTGVTARCPGAASEPAEDRSNPWIPTDLGKLCDPAQTPRP